MLDGVDLNMLYQAKVLQKMVQHLDIINNLPTESTFSEIEDVPPIPEGALQEKELTPEEQEAHKLYEMAKAMLNKTRPDKQQAYQLLVGAANKGNYEAKALVAWAKLFGNPLKQDVHVARGMFEELAELGNPDGHMGLGKQNLFHSVFTAFYPFV